MYVKDDLGKTSFKIQYLLTMGLIFI